MICRTIKTEHGFAIVCSRSRRRKCHYCDRPATLLCDHPGTNGKTCDRPMCGDHAIKIGPDQDHCQEHRP